MYLKMSSKNMFFSLGFWVGLAQNLGFDFSVRLSQQAYHEISMWLGQAGYVSSIPHTCDDLRLLGSSQPSHLLSVAATLLLSVGGGPIHLGAAGIWATRSLLLEALFLL